MHYVPCGYRDYAQHRMELWDDGDSPLVTAVFEVPGLRPADVTVDVVDGRLVISGERRQPEQGFSAAPKTSPPGNENGTHCSEPTEPGTVCVRASEETLAHAGTITVLQIRELKYGSFRRVVAVPAGCTVSVSRELAAIRLTDEGVSTSAGGPSPSYDGERDAHRLMAPRPWLAPLGHASRREDAVGSPAGHRSRRRLHEECLCLNVSSCTGSVCGAEGTPFALSAPHVCVYNLCCMPVCPYAL